MRFFGLVGLMGLMVHGSFAATQIQFRFTWEGKSAAIGEKYILPNGDTLIFQNCRMYIGIGAQPSKVQYVLLDLEKSVTSEVITIKCKRNADTATLNLILGVDTALQEKGVQKGSLDPIHGMYWSWQTGYIHYKFEGVYISSNGEKKSFEYHLGGYAGVQNSVVYKTVKIKTGQVNEIQLPLNLVALVLPFSTQPGLMSPGKLSVQISRNISTVIKCL